MTLRTLILKNLIFFRRTNIAIVAGVAIAVSVLAGALQIGQSVRDSLRTILFERIGATEYLVASSDFFSEGMTEALAPGLRSCPIVVLKGMVVNEGTRVQAHDVNVYGIDDRFWKFHGISGEQFSTDRSALVGSDLAYQIGVKGGDNLLLRVETQQAIPREWLYGRRESTGRTIRLTCRSILPGDKLGEFALRPTQGRVPSIFVPLKRLQQDLDQPSRINSILLSGSGAGTDETLASIRNGLRRRCTLSDLGVKVRDLPSHNGFSVESSHIILDDTLAQAAAQSASANGLQGTPVYTYLANSIRANGKDIPYSVITAADLNPGQKPPSGDSIWLSDWAARDLGASPGDPVEIDYYLWLESGKLVTRAARFHLAGVLPLSGNLDASFAPEIPGITEANSISSWDPPFPLDLSRIRSQDEDFWNRYKATPKAIITLARGQDLWKNRFGKITAVRIALPEGSDPVAAKDRLVSSLLQRLDPEKFGLNVTAIKGNGLAASRGSTDFGEYFAYFSSFLIMAAIFLSAMFFKLMIEQRVREIGILRAAGYPVPKLRRIFIIEGSLLCIAGSTLGLLGSIAYGWFMILGLRTLWVGAVGTNRLYFHASWKDLGIGAAIGIIFSLTAIVWTLRKLQSNSPRALLAGVLESASAQVRRARVLGIAALFSAALAGILLIVSAAGKMAQMPGFFGSGFLLLVSILCATARYLRSQNPNPIYGNGWHAFLRFGVKNAMHRPGRSLVCAALIASATFIVISMEAFRQDSQGISLEPKSGTGGYSLVAESAIPVIHDLNSEDGREATGLSGLNTKDVKDLQFTAFRERPGDDASCLNLYAPQEPKILGAPHGFIQSGRFSFQDSLAANENQKRNPWLLLESPPQDSTIPAVADANTIQYILHLTLGNEIPVRGNQGNPVRLRLVAALKDSIFQGELLISESNFLRLFPEHQGYRFFLMDAPRDRAGDLRKSLQETLSDWGFNIESSQERLSGYHKVENAYLSTFQSLGGLGLVLGTFGLAAVLLRNVLERRQELALLRAVGYRKRALSGIILAENLILVCWGLASGAVCAFLAIIPALESRGTSFPFLITGLILAAVFAAGLISSVFAVIAALRSPLLASLRSE